MEIKINEQLVVERVEDDRPRGYRPQGESPNPTLTYGMIPVGGTFILDGKVMRKLEGGARSARGRGPRELMKIHQSMLVGRVPTIV